jgi:adenosylhomocysteine nucleosidase
LNATGVVAALAAEARTLGSALRREDGLASLGEGILVAVSGIGCSAAAPAARKLLDAGAGALVSWGMAGGLDPELRAGTICLPDEVISAEGATFTVSQAWRERLRAAIPAQRRVVAGKLLSSARAIDAVAGKAVAFRTTGAVAVDMESAAVAQVAAAHRVPFIAVRVIVDTAADVLPESVVGASRAGQVQIRQLALGLLRSPAEIAALWRLARRYRAPIGYQTGVARTGALVLRGLTPADVRIA